MKSHARTLDKYNSLVTVVENNHHDWLKMDTRAMSLICGFLIESKEKTISVNSILLKC